MAAEITACARTAEVFLPSQPTPYAPLPKVNTIVSAILKTCFGLCVSLNTPLTPAVPKVRNIAPAYSDTIKEPILKKALIIQPLPSRPNHHLFTLCKRNGGIIMDGATLTN